MINVLKPFEERERERQRRARVTSWFSIPILLLTVGMIFGITAVAIALDSYWVVVPLTVVGVTVFVALPGELMRRWIHGQDPFKSY